MGKATNPRARSTAAKAPAKAKAAPPAKANPNAVKVANAFASGVKGINDAKAALVGAGMSQLALIQTALKGVAGVTADAWDAAWKDAAKAALIKSNAYSEKSVGPALSRLKVGVICLSNDIAPQKGETFAQYVQRARPLAVKKRLMEASKAGAPKGGKTPKSQAQAKAKPLTRADALKVACGKGQDAMASLLDTALQRYPQRVAWLAKRLVELAPVDGAKLDLVIVE